MTCIVGSASRPGVWCSPSTGERADSDPAPALEHVDGILVPGGFGERGSEGKIAAIKFARERKIPFLGICLGMQMAVCEYARSFAELPNAHSSEFDPNLDGAVIALMAEQEGVTEKGGTKEAVQAVVRVNDFTVAVVAPAEPDNVTSPVANPVTGSENTTSNTTGLAFVGSIWEAP